MTILAFDPGLRKLGIAMLVGDELYLATSMTGTMARGAAYWHQYQAIEGLIQMTPYGEDLTIVMEGPAYGMGVRNREELAVIRGLIEMAADPREVRRFSPSALKKFVTGNGRAAKLDVYKAMCDKAAARGWTLPATPDEADALALLLMARADG